MGLAGRLGQAVFCCACKCYSDGVFQKAFVAYGDEDGFDVGACSEYCADSLALRIVCCILGEVHPQALRA